MRRDVHIWNINGDNVSNMNMDDSRIIRLGIFSPAEAQLAGFNHTASRFKETLEIASVETYRPDRFCG